MGALSAAEGEGAETALVEVSFTCTGTEEARALLSELLAARLVACGHHAPVSSAYWWNGRLEAAEEELVTVTTRRDRFEAIVEMLRRRHSYDLPSITMRPLVGAAPGIESWVRDSLS